jgi:hypothetical protein
MKSAILPIALLTLTALVLSCGGDGGSTPTGSPGPSRTITRFRYPTPTLSPAPTPSPTPIPGSIELTRGPDLPFPEDMAFIVEEGCFRCDGPATGLVRVYRDPSGSIRSESLFDPLAQGYPPRIVTGPDGQVSEQIPFLSGPVANPDGSVIAIGVCIRHDCGDDGLIGWNADAEAVILRSRDGGVTWEEIARGGPGLNVVAIAGDDGVLTVNYLDPAGRMEYRIFPGGELLVPPAGSTLEPPLSAGGTLLWHGADGALLLSDGSPLNEGDVFGYGVTGELDSERLGDLLVAKSGGGPFIFSLVAYEFREDETAVRTFVSNQSLSLGWWAETRERAIVSTSLPDPPNFSGQVPAVLDLSTAEYRLLTEHFLSEMPSLATYGRTYVAAVHFGPFARVTGTSSCLNVRAEPSLSAQVLTCMADGVLLTDAGETQGADGVTWVRVTTPDNTVGWASAAFLER